jgi:hypothetical protein
MKSSVTSILIIILFIFGCVQDQQDQQDAAMQTSQPGKDPGTSEIPVIDAPESFRISLNNALESYFDLKDALVQSDAGMAAEKATGLREAAGSVDSSALPEEIRPEWLFYQERILTGSALIAAETNVEEQRVHFGTLSETMIEAVKRFRPAGFTVYEQMCPMVRDGSANWLSKEEQIANPYHGDRMMRCGSVVDRI